MSVGNYFKVRAGVVVIQNDKILLVRQNNRDFWVFPGGTQEIGEGMEECAIREIKEETNLDVHIQKFLYVSDFIRPSRHSIDVFFLAHVLPDSDKLIMETTENLNDIGWFSQDEMATLDVKPEGIAKQIHSDWQTNFNPPSGRYLGKYHF